MKRIIFLLLAAALTVSLFGCVDVQNEAQDAGQDEYHITWKKAFRNELFPEGGLMNDEVAFARTLGGAAIVDNLPQSELIGFDDEGYLPRYSLIHSEETEGKTDLLPACISYALIHHYDRFVLPLDTAKAYVPQGKDREYWWTMDVECDTDKSNYMYSDTGSTIFYFLCVLKTPLSTPDYAEWNKEQDIAFEAAKMVIRQMPEDCTSDYDKVLYLYRYLTDNVQYAYEQEYPMGEDYYTYAQNLYYDTLVSHRTVCAGYGRTLAWLCELAGLEAFPASGQYGATESHLWTMVKVDDGYYWFDPTWDAGEYPEYYQYFGISDQDMEERGGVRHLYQAYDEMLPDCPESLPLPPVTGLSFSRGAVSGSVYQNEAFGLLCEIPNGWVYLDDTQIGQGDGESLTPFETLLSEQNAAYDMYAINEKGEELYTEVYRRSERPAEFADLLKESLLQASDDAVCEKREVSFCGKTCVSLQASLTLDGSALCLEFVILPIDGALLVLRSYSYDLERCAQILDYFTAIKG